MEIIQGLYSTDISTQQNTYQQIQLLSNEQIIQIYQQTQDIILLSCIKVDSISLHEVQLLIHSDHVEKISQIAAKFIQKNSYNSEQFQQFMAQLDDNKLKVYIIKELLQLKVSMTPFIYQYAITIVVQDYDLLLTLLDSLSIYCQIEAKQFQSILNHQFLTEGIKDQYIQRFSIVLVQIFNKFKYSTKTSVDSLLLKEVFKYLLNILLIEHHYKYGIILMSSLFLVIQNRHLNFFDVFIDYLKYAIFALQQFNHFNCYLLIPSLIKLYEQRQIQQTRNIYHQLVNDNKRIEQLPTLKLMIDSSLKSIDVSIEEIQYFDSNIDQATLQLFHILSGFADKRSISGLIRFSNFYGNDANIQSYELALYNEYNTMDPLFWQDWFGVFRGLITQLVSKIAILYPQQSLLYSIEILTESWRQVSQITSFISMKDNEYLNIDLAIVFIDPIITTILKLILNENDYIKQTLLDLDTYQQLVDLLLVDQFKQPVVLYKTLVTAAQIPRFITKIELSIQQELQSKVPFNNQKQLLFKFQSFCSLLTKKIISKLFQNINFRLDTEVDITEEFLFQHLSQDTLALRRMIVTKLNSYLTSQQIVVLLAEYNETPDSLDYNFDLAKQFIAHIEHLKQQHCITETEIINLDLVQLSLLINIQKISSESITAQNFKNQLQIMLNDLISNMNEFYNQQKLLSAIQDQEFFNQYFNLNNISFDLINRDSIQTKRQFLFKLNQAVIIIPKISELIQSQDLMLILQNIFSIITLFIQRCIHMSSLLKYQSQSFVYNNSPLKVNLVQHQSQYLQVDIDSIQDTITERSYNLEWIENCISMGLQLLVYCNQHQNIIQILNYSINYNLPFSILKTFFDKINKLSFINVSQQQLQTYFNSLMKFHTYFYDPYSYIMKIDQHDTYYNIYSNFIDSLPVNERIIDFDQILVLHDKITKQQLESTMLSIQQAVARSFIEILSKIFYDTELKSQTEIQLTEQNIQALTMLQFIENKPYRIFGLIEQLQFTTCIDQLCIGILIHSTIDSQLLSQAIAIFAKNYIYFPQIQHFLNPQNIDTTSLRNLKQTICFQLKNNGFK